LIKSRYVPVASIRRVATERASEVFEAMTEGSGGSVTPEQEEEEEGDVLSA
jgi:hypothetical protein